jgi:integration host factor subunit alpha
MDPVSATNAFRTKVARSGGKKRALTRSDLANAIHRKVGLTQAESAQYVDMVLEEISDSLVAREDVKLSSFGAFLVRAKKERLGRNPKTGISATVSARLVVCFKSSKILRARINGDDRRRYNRA